jgi:hypothetical protein
MAVSWRVSSCCSLACAAWWCSSRSCNHQPLSRTTRHDTRHATHDTTRAGCQYPGPALPGSRLEVEEAAGGHREAAAAQAEAQGQGHDRHHQRLPRGGGREMSTGLCGGLRRRQLTEATELELLATTRVVHHPSADEFVTCQRTLIRQCIARHTHTHTHTHTARNGTARTRHDTARYYTEQSSPGRRTRWCSPRCSCRSGWRRCRAPRSRS